jgi:hypothetical protein
MRKNYFTAILLGLISLNGIHAQNQNYLMDASFGNSGYKFIPTAMPRVLSVDIFSGSKIRITGYNLNALNNDGHKTVQLLSTGLLDTGFSTDGIESGTPTFFRKSYATAINNNTEVLIIGRDYTPEFEYKIIKVKNNGLADLNFGNSGIVISANDGLDEDSGFIIQLLNGSFIFSTESDYKTSIKSLTSNGSAVSSLYNSYPGSSSLFQSYCKTKSGKILLSGSYYYNNTDWRNMYHFLNADGSTLKLVYQDDNQTVGSEGVPFTTYDEVNQIFVTLEDFYNATSDARYHLKTFDSNGDFIARYTYSEADFGFHPLKTISLGGYTYVLGIDDLLFNLKIAKLDKNGSFDSSFGNGGTATIDITENITKIDNVTSDNLNSIFVTSGNMSSSTSVFVMKINLSNTLGIDDFTSNDLNSFVFPNPTEGVVNFKEKVDKVILFDINGKTLKEFKDANNADLSEFQNGVYFLNLTTNSKSSTKKVILKK